PPGQSHVLRLAALDHRNAAWICGDGTGGRSRRTSRDANSGSHPHGRAVRADRLCARCAAGQADGRRTSDPRGRGLSQGDVPLVPQLESEKRPQLLPVVAAPGAVIVDEPPDGAWLEEALS